MKRLAAVVAVALMTAACGSDSPTTPSKRQHWSDNVHAYS